MKTIDPVELLKALVAIPSPSGDESAVAEAVRQWAVERGLAAEMAGRNVVIRTGPAGGKRLLVNSHLDTVPPAADWRTDPHQPVEEDGRIIGLGANDAKGSVAAMLCAVAGLPSEALEGEVVLALTVEEETGQGAGLESVIEQLGELDAAVIGEPTSLGICNAQKGLLILKVETRGDARHAAHAHRIEGANAIVEAARAVIKLEGWAPEPNEGSKGVLTCHVTTIEGGTRRNMIADRCGFTLDIRTLEGVPTEEIVNAVAEKTGANVTVISDRLKPFHTGFRTAIVQAATRVRPMAPLIVSDTMSDAVWTRHLPTIKVGPGATDRSHRPGEYITREELVEGVDFYARLIREYFSPNGKAQS